MSLGGIIGGIVGGVAGFMLTGNLYGAWVGFTIGFGLGMMIDPLEPDLPSPGQPLLNELNLNTAEEGLPLPDILGTTKLGGNIVWYGNERTEEIQEEQEVGGGGKGGGSSTQTVTTGYKYYLTWAMVICMGPVDKLYTIYMNDDVVWSGNLSRPVSGGVETITLDKMGSAKFYFGTDDQTAPSELSSLDPYNIPYRNQCWILFNDCYIGDYNRAPRMNFVVGKFPTFDFDSNNTINTYDYNPAHAIYYVCNSMVNLPATFLNSTSFSGVAQTLRVEEKGLSILFDQYNAAETYLESILAHIKGIIKFSSDGQFHLKLLRNDTATTDMTTVTAADVVVENYDFDRKSWIDTLNDVKLQYAQRVFREPVCPNSTEGITLISGSADMDPDTTYTFTINNPESQQYFGLDCTTDFLDDNGGGGTFSNIRRNEDGTWSFDYTTPSDLCESWECPTIGGVLYDCCRCETADPVDWSGDNPTTLIKSDMATVSVSGGLSPYVWSITGTGCFFDAGYTQTTYTGSSSATIYTNAAACGPVNVTVTDKCLTSDSAGLYAPGSWSTAGSVLCGNCLGLCSTMYYYITAMDRYSINYRPTAACWCGYPINAGTCGPYTPPLSPGQVCGYACQHWVC